MADRGVSVRLTARVDQYVRAMGQAQQATGAVGRDWDKVAGKMKSVGRDLSKWVTLPIVGAGAAAVKLGTDFNTTFAQMVGLANVPADEVDRLKESVMSLAGETGRAPQELAEALYFAASAGLDSADAMEAVEVAAKAAAVGMGDASTITGLLASVLSAYGDDAIDSARATDILTAAIREGRAEPSEMAGALGKVLPIASQLGITFEEVAGATAFMSNIIGDTDETVVRLNGVLKALLDPSKQGRDALKDMGGSAEELRSAVGQDGLAGALQYLHDHGFADNETALANLFEDSRALQGALILLNDESGRLAPTMAAVADSAGSLDTAWGAMDQDALALKQAWAELQVALIQAGEILIPIVTDLANGVADLAGWFSDLSPEAQKLILVLAAIAASGGPALLVVASMIRSVQTLTGALAALRGAMAAGSLAALTNPLTLMVAAVGAAAIAFGVMGDNAKTAEQRLDDLHDAAVDGTKTWKEYVSGIVLNSDVLRESFAESNVSVDDLLTAIAGGNKTFFEFLRSVKWASVEGMNLADSQAAIRDELIPLLRGYDDWNTILGQTATVTGDTRDETDRFADSVLRSGDAAQVAGDDLEDLGDSAEAPLTKVDMLRNLFEQTARTALLGKLRDKAGFDDLAGDADRASWAISGVQTAIQRLRDELSDEQAFFNVGGDFRRREESARRAAEAWDRVAHPQEGDDPAQLVRDAEQATRDLTQATFDQERGVLDYLDTIDALPDSVVTEVVALLDEGKYEEAEAKLAELEATREAFININYAIPSFELKLPTGPIDVNYAIPGYILSPPPPPDAQRGGPRANGGPVRPGLAYPVLERGEPELLTVGAETYLMTPGSGMVTPMSSLAPVGGSGGDVSLSIGSVSLPNVTRPRDFMDALAREIRASGPGPLRRALAIGN